MGGLPRLYTVVLIKSEELLLEQAELVLNVLHISTKGCLQVDILPSTYLGETLLYGLSDLLGELEGGDTVLQLDVGRIEVDTEQDFGVRGQHGLIQNLCQQRVVLGLERALEGGGEQRLGETVEGEGGELALPFTCTRGRC